MKQLAILIAAVAMIGFVSSESFGQHYHGGRGHGGGHTSWGISLGNGFGSGFTFGQGAHGNNFYGLSIGGGGGYRGYAPVYRPVPAYRHAYPSYGYGGGYRGGFYGGGHSHRCGGW